jgi:hypothetical protein
MQNGKLKPVIDRRYGLDHVTDAIRYQETFHARGKLALTVGSIPGAAQAGAIGVVVPVTVFVRRGFQMIA